MTGIIRPLRTRIARWRHWAAHFSGYSTRRLAEIPAGCILLFHGIDDGEEGESALYGKLQYLAERFRIIALADFVSRLEDGGPPLAGAAALTFDDGLGCQASVMAPQLQRLGLPATFFLSTDLIEERAWQWNHDCRERLQFLPPRTRAHWARAAGAPSFRPPAIIEWMKSLAEVHRSALAEEIRGLTPGFAPSIRQHRCYDPMTWEEVASLPDCISLGSHGCRHTVLTLLDVAGLDREICESRRELESKSGRPVEWFSYPNGRLDPGVVSRVRDAYRAACGMSPGWVTRASDPAVLPRINADGSLSAVTWRLHSAGRKVPPS